MSRVQRLERLISNARRRLELAQDDVSKIKGELRELSEKLESAKLEEEQLSLPFVQRGRRPSEKWSAILNFMLLRSPHAVNIDEILNFSVQNNLDLSRAAIRAQLYHYHQRGIVDRIEDGLFLPTESTKVYCDY